MKKIHIFLLMLFFSIITFGQVGINTENPQGIFNVDGGKDNPTAGIPNTTQQMNDFVVTTTGNVGVGTIDPKVRLDLRTSGDNNIIGIGYTSLSAADAGAGAIRYVDRSGGKIQVSNGIVWQDIPSVPVKSNVVARINAPNNSHKFSYDVPKNIENWQELSDPTNSFNPTTGLFTAPRDGVYTISFSFNFVSGPILGNSSVESQLIKNGSTVAVKCLKTYGKATRPAQSAGNCVTSISLQENETVNVRLLQKIDNTTSGGRGLRSIASPPQAINHPFFGFNNLTIVEQ